MNYLANAGQILIDFAFGVLVALFVLRVMLQCVRANFYNPICQFLYRITNPVLMPLRKVIPPWRNLDLAGIVIAWLLTALKLALLYATLGATLGVEGLALMALADLIGFVLMIYLGLILARVVLGFLNTDTRHPLVPLIVQLTNPILRPIQRHLPVFGGIDLSPVAAWLIILLARVLIVQPLLDAGLRLAQAS
ncbi:MAG TPA: YggT family protein [Rhodanobacteraceae bacterium]|nr:YggT family protein [Rhodanobacteraceae bacterium]